LQVLVLANNRRVDVTLSTTGQQSTRPYPFNAKDYLALINPKSGEKKATRQEKAQKVIAERGLQLIRDLIYQPVFGCMDAPPTSLESDVICPKSRGESEFSFFKLHNPKTV